MSSMLIFAHRGVRRRGIADENSVAAFSEAVRLGIDGIELDVRVTRDGKAVVLHDADLRRVAGDNRKVEALTHHDLEQVELRHGAGIPLLDDVTACVPPPIRIDFEVKDPEAFEIVARKLKTSAGLRARALISTFHEDVAAEARKVLPDVKCFLLMKHWPILWSRFAERAAELGVSGIGCSSNGWTDVRAEKAKAHGFETVAWEPMGLRSMRHRAIRLEKIGIDILIANNPGVYV